MRLLSAALLLSLCVMAVSCGKPEGGGPKGAENGGSPVGAIRLYSRQSDAGDWEFCLTKDDGRGRTAEEIFAAQPILHGIDELKHAILQTAPRSGTVDVVWSDRFGFLSRGGVETDGTPALAYPPADIVKEVARYGAEHRVRVSYDGPAVPVYEMFSWETPQGDWSFHIRSGFLSSTPDADDVFDPHFALHGVDQLKNEISKLPVGSDILWSNLVAANVEGLAYPPEEMISEIRLYAETRKIEIEIKR